MLLQEPVKRFASAVKDHDSFSYSMLRSSITLHMAPEYGLLRQQNSISLPGAMPHRAKVNVVRRSFLASLISSAVSSASTSFASGATNSNLSVYPCINNPKCCRKNVSFGIYAFVNDENIREQLDLNSKAHPVTYNPTGERSDAKNWLIDKATVIIHEVLHLFGVIDEYLDKVNYPNKTEKDLPQNHNSSIMGNTDGEANIYPSHLEQIIKLSEVKQNELKDCSFSIKYNR